MQNDFINTFCEIRLEPLLSSGLGAVRFRAEREQLERFSGLNVKSRPKSGRDCLMCAIFAQQMIIFMYYSILGDIRRWAPMRASSLPVRGVGAQGPCLQSTRIRAFIRMCAQLLPVFVNLRSTVRADRGGRDSSSAGASGEIEMAPRTSGGAARRHGSKDRPRAADMEVR